ncbi:fec operon regulator FecR [compost metagenome]
MKKEEIRALIKKYTEGNATAEEAELLESWYLQQESSELISAEDLKADLKAIGDRLPLHQPVVNIPLYKRFSKTKFAAAAVLLVVFSVGLFFYNKSDENTVAMEILPGGNKALLTLGDGQKISLNDAADGNIADQANVSITKTADGQLIYTVVNAEDNSLPASYNTVETPKGGQFNIVLPDGTKVWLNAASSLRFPTYFAGKQRKVELSGEGYFEVSRNKEAPFIVKTDHQEVEVLGTKFNINSYKDEGVTKTTLLEGRVRVSSAFAVHTLKPGQQSLLKGTSLAVADVDTEIAVAWKNGQFMFNDEHLEVIMRQISRWYDVEVAFAHKPAPTKLFWGTISRFENVSQVLEILEMTKSVKFKIEGRRIIVLN